MQAYKERIKPKVITSGYIKECFAPKMPSTPKIQGKYGGRNVISDVKERSFFDLQHTFDNEDRALKLGEKAQLPKINLLVPPSPRSPNPSVETITTRLLGSRKYIVGSSLTPRLKGVSVKSIAHADCKVKVNNEQFSKIPALAKLKEKRDAMAKPKYLSPLVDQYGKKEGQFRKSNEY